MRDRAPHWVPLVEKGEFNFNGNAKHLAIAIKAAGATSAIPALVKLLAEGKVAEADQAEVIPVIASLGGPDELKLVLDAAQAEATPSARRAALLYELAATARMRNVKLSGDLSRLGTLARPSGEGSGKSAQPTELAVIYCIGAWRVEALRAQVAQLASTGETPVALRQAALDTIAELGGPQSDKLLVEQADSKQPLPIRITALAALSASDLKLATAMSVEMLQELDRSPASSEKPGFSR